MYKDREKLLASQKRYNEAHREERRELARLWRLNNKEKKLAYDKEYKKTHKYKIKYKYKNTFKVKVRKQLQHAVRKGKIKRLPCEVCFDPKSEAHHEDYTKPFQVRWLCAEHHRKIHKVGI